MARNDFGVFLGRRFLRIEVDSNGGGALFSSFPSSCHCLRTSAICSVSVIVFAGT